MPVHRGYRGLAKLARNSGEIEIIEAHPVYPGDKFVVRRGTVTEFVHEPDYLGGGERTEGATCYYALARYKSGAVQFEVMTRAQIETIMRATQSKESMDRGLTTSTSKHARPAFAGWPSPAPGVRRSTRIFCARSKSPTPATRETQISRFRLTLWSSQSQPIPMRRQSKRCGQPKGRPKPDPQAEYEEGKRLFETLNNHNPDLARTIWGKQMSMSDKIAELRKEVQSVEGGPA